MVDVLHTALPLPTSWAFPTSFHTTIKSFRSIKALTTDSVASPFPNQGRCNGGLCSIFLFLPFPKVGILRFLYHSHASTASRHQLSRPCPVCGTTRCYLPWRELPRSRLFDGFIRTSSPRSRKSLISISLFANTPSEFSFPTFPCT